MGPTREFISLFSKELQNRQYHFWNDSDDSPCLLVSSSSSFPPPNLPSNIGFVICRCGEWVLKHCPTHRSLLCLDSVGAWKCSEGDFSVSSYDSICPNCGQSLQFCLQLRYNNATNMIQSLSLTRGFEQADRLCEIAHAFNKLFWVHEMGSTEWKMPFLRSEFL